MTSKELQQLLDEHNKKFLKSSGSTILKKFDGYGKTMKTYRNFVETEEWQEVCTVVDFLRKLHLDEDARLVYPNIFSAFMKKEDEEVETLNQKFHNYNQGLSRSENDKVLANFQRRFSDEQIFNSIKTGVMR